MRPTTALAPGAADARTAEVPRTLIVPVDGSDFAARAMPVARGFAARFGADVVALTTPHSLERATWTETPAWLRALVAEPSPVPVRSVVADTMEATDAVVAEVAAHPATAVCMATHARGTVGSTALGNVAQEVVRRVGTPVLLVGRHCRVDEEPAGGPIVVAHDGSTAADAVLGAARTWARACDVPLVLLHVYHPLDTASPARPDAVLDACRRLGPSTRLEVAAASFSAGAIRDLAHELDASAIAMATHGRTGAAAVSMGRVASWVTRESACPVLVVRPTDLSG